MSKSPEYTKYLEWLLLITLILGILFISKELAFIENLKPDTKTAKIMMFLGIVLMMFLALGAHELGHLITGLLNGFRFELFVVGPLGIRRENDLVKIYHNTNLGYYGGVAATSPKIDEPENAKKFARILLAGPLASLLFSAICFSFTYFAGKPFGIIFYAGGLMSLAIFLATTIPSKTGMFFTDRKRYQRLVNPGKDQKVESAMLKIMGTYSKDNSYKNINKDDLDILITDEFLFVKYYGLFNLICFQIENNGLVNENVLAEYEQLSTTMSKSLVTAFNNEIEAFKVRVATDLDQK